MRPYFAGAHGGVRKGRTEDMAIPIPDGANPLSAPVYFAPESRSPHYLPLAAPP